MSVYWWHLNKKVDAFKRRTARPVSCLRVLVLASGGGVGEGGTPVLVLIRGRVLTPVLVLVGRREYPCPHEKYPCPKTWLGCPPSSPLWKDLGPGTSEQEYPLPSELTNKFVTGWINSERPPRVVSTWTSSILCLCGQTGMWYVQVQWLHHYYVVPS